MRLGTIRRDGVDRIVDLRNGGPVQLDFPGDLLALIRSGVDPETLTTSRLPDAPRLRAPLRPGKIVGIGLNYADHVRESGADTPERPLIFAKFPSSVIGPDDPIEFDPANAQRVDWEVELAVVVGATLRRASIGEALSRVFGYTAANDVSARDVQFADGQWVRGKSLDTFCPLGPVLVTPDEIGDVQGLALQARVNGQVMQNSSTREMIFGVGELLSFCSQNFTLDAGDVVLTGTPWGCGEFMTPRRSLQDGDIVEVEVAGIGTLRNPVATMARRDEVPTVHQPAR